MEIKITINDKLITALKKVFTKKNSVFIIAVALFCGGLVLFSQQVVELDTFHDGDIIYAGPINDNFTALKERELGSIADVDTSGAADGQVLKYNGTSWAAGNDIGGAGGAWEISGSDIYYTDGNVGIDTTSPNAKLEIAQGSVGGMRLTGISPSIEWYQTDQDVDEKLWDLVSSGLYLHIRTGNDERSDFSSIVSIARNGNVGIGTTGPTSKLQVTGLPIHADNTAALGAGLTAGAFYHNGDGIVRVVY